MKTLLTLIITVFSFNTYSQNLSGMVGWWPLNGNFNDSSGNAQHGVPMHAPVVSMDRFNNPNGAMSFDGVQQLATLGDILDTIFCNSPVAKFSITGWAKTKTINPNFGAGLILAKEAGGTGPDQWSISHFNDSTIRGIVKTNSATNYVEWKTTTKFPVNQWFFFTLMFDGSDVLPNNRVKLFVNAEPTVFSRSNGTFGTKCYNSNQHITIGAGHLAGDSSIAVNQYNGSVDDIRIFNRVLSFNEMTQLYTNTVSTSEINNSTLLNSYIYPNPSSDGLFNLKVNENVTYTIFTINGSLIESGRIESEKLIELHDSGIYFLQLVDNEGNTENHKLIKLQTN